MSRRDIIIVAVLTNLGLLAVLFLMAINGEDEGYRDTPLIEDAAVSKAKPFEIKTEEKVFLAQQNEVDEVDTLLKVFANASNNDFEKVKESAHEVLSAPEPVVTKVSKPIGDSQNALEVTVKKGDVLSKIATSNGTTVTQLKKLNNLTTDQLKVGQTLKIPGQGIKLTPKADRPLADNSLEEPKKGEFYVIQSGDNPWNIAKKFGISVSDLLKMNDMDEKKAKNLKIGQKIRVG